MTGFTRSFLRTALVVAPFALFACTDSTPPPAAPQAPAAPAPAPAPAPKAEEKAPEAKAEGNAAEEAKEIYLQRCVTCHGPAGEGDGIASASLNPKPRNLQDHDWQDSVTDEHIEKIIVEGGPAVGKSVLMPGNPDLADKPEVVAALTEFIRSLKK